MKKSIYSSEGALVRECLVRMRTEAGLSQRQLAQRIGREHSFVSRVEQGERRVDLVEFYWLCEALGRDANKVYAELIRKFKKL